MLLTFRSCATSPRLASKSDKGVAGARNWTNTVAPHSEGMGGFVQKPEPIEGDRMFKSPFPDEVIPKLSVYDFLFKNLDEEDAARIALIDGPSGAETSYGQLKAQIDLLAGSLASRGLGIGDVIALHSPNVPAFATVFHGILRSGATATTVNALYTDDEMERQLTDSGAKMLFTVSPLLAVASAAAAAAGIPDDQIIVLDGHEGYTGLRELLGEGKAAPEIDFDPATHVAVIPYSSGTTGFAKGVMLSHTNLVANV